MVDLKTNVKYLIVRIYFLFVLFLYTYSRGVNTGVLYARRAIILFFISAIMYLLYYFEIKKYKIFKKMEDFDIIVICLIGYIMFSTVLYPRSLVTNLNISIMTSLMYLVIKVFQYEANKKGLDIVLNKYKFVFDTFILFIFLSTIVACLYEFWGIKLFDIPDTFRFKRAQSWFNNSTVYGINIVIAMSFVYNKYKENKNKVFIPLLVWFGYWLLMSGGRTGVIVLVVGIMINLILRYRKKIIFISIPILLLILGAYQYLYNHLMSNFLIFRRFEQGGLGSRDVKFFEVRELWNKQSLINQLFGSGTNSLRDEFSYSAHSGFLKLFFDNGLVFLVIYAIFVLIVCANYIILIRKVKDKKVKNFLITGLSLVVMFFVAETMIIITMSAIYDFALLMLISGFPFIYRKSISLNSG